jgi:hypothetical protein
MDRIILVQSDRGTQHSIQRLVSNILKILLISLSLTCCTNEIQKTAMVIAAHPQDSIIIDSAVNVLWKIILEDFPKDEYNFSLTIDEIKERLPGALTFGNERPVLLGITPKRVNSHNGRWTWNTYLYNLSGIQAKIGFLQTKITVLDGTTYGSPEIELPMPITINGFRSASHEHWIDRFETVSDGGIAILTYTQSKWGGYYVSAETKLE